MTSFLQAARSVLASVWAAIRPGTEPPNAADELAASHVFGGDDARACEALAVGTAAAAPIAAARDASTSSLDQGMINSVVAAATAAERQRCSDILRSNAAVGLMPLALQFAFSSNMPAAECLGHLASAQLDLAAQPAADPLAGLSRLDRHMTRLGIVVAPVAQPKPPVILNLSDVYAERAAAVPGRPEGGGNPGTKGPAPREANAGEIYASRAAATARAKADDQARRPKVRGESDGE